jgi:hypothetical protein
MRTPPILTLKLLLTSLLLILQPEIILAIVGDEVALAILIDDLEPVLLEFVHGGLVAAAEAAALDRRGRAGGLFVLGAAAALAREEV